MRVFGGTVLAAIFAAELAAFAAYAVWGWGHAPRLVLVWFAPLLAITAWGLLAAPRARFDNPISRLITQVLVLGGAIVAFATSGHRWAALALLVVVVTSHALAALPPVRALRSVDAASDPDLGAPADLRRRRP